MALWLALQLAKQMAQWSDWLSARALAAQRAWLSAQAMVQACHMSYQMVLLLAPALGTKMVHW